MTSTGDAAVARFDALTDGEARALLATCCGSSAWVSGMLARRPFATLDRLLREADERWWSLSPDDWREAFAHHPRIGGRAAPVPQGEVARRWSAAEQSAAAAAPDDVRRALAEENAGYERRFGYVYLVCATGKTASEMLALLRQRMANDPDGELRVAAREQAKITRLRLRKMLDEVASTVRSA